MVTYSQMGKAIRAIFLWAEKSTNTVLEYDNNTKGMSAIDKMICDIKIVK